MENNPELIKSESLTNIIQIPISVERFEVNKQKPAFDGPISGPLWGKVSKLNSNYPDTFDWAMYDRIYDRFGSAQPRGGILFKSSLRLQNYHESCSKCHYSLEVDTYGRGCIHNCSYCYAKDSLTKHGYWNRPMPFPIDLSEIRNIFCKVFESNSPTKWRNILEKRIPIRIGSMSDAFMWMDRKYRVTHELLKILSFYNYPYIVFTRSDLIATDEYMAELRPDLASVQFSISGNNEDITDRLEPGAPSVKRRLEALKKLGNEGYWTTVRINPLFPTYPDGYFTDPESIRARFGSPQNVPKLPWLDIDQPEDFFGQLAEARVRTVLAGFARLTSYSVNQMSKSLNVDFKAFFKPEAIQSVGKGNTDKNFSDSEIRHYYQTLHRAALSRGLRFSTCYIGNGLKDYYQYQALWSNKSDCCDSKRNVKGFGTSCQEIDWAERFRHASKKNLAERALQEEQYVAAKLQSSANVDSLSHGLIVQPRVLQRRARQTEINP